MHLNPVLRTAVALVTGLALCSADAAQPQAAVLTEGDSAVVGRVAVCAPPEEVFALLTTYQGWPAVFSDVEEVKSITGDLVAFRSRAFRHAVTMRFANIPARQVSATLTEGPRGVAVEWQTTLLATQPGGPTQIEMRLMTKAHSLPSQLIPEEVFRRVRREKVSADLADLVKRLQTPGDNGTCPPRGK